MIDKFLTSNATTYRLARTILQGIIAVVIANLDVLFGFAHMSGSTKAFVVALTMAVLSPIMGALSSNGKTIEAYSGGIPDEAKEATGETEVEEDSEG